MKRALAIFSSVFFLDQLSKRGRCAEVRMSTQSSTETLAVSNDLVHVAIENITELLKHPRMQAEDRLEVMLTLTRRKPVAVFWPVFHATWLACDNSYRLRNRLLKVLSSRDSESRSTNYLPQDAKDFFDQLPNPFTAFRVCSKARVLGISWTTSETLAEDRAAGNGMTACRNPSLATASVPKSAVFGVYRGDKGVELAINPRRVRVNVRPLADSKTPSSPYAEWQQLIGRFFDDGHAKLNSPSQNLAGDRS